MNDKKRKQKQYYVNQAKRAKFEKRKLHGGLRGFLCTTNNKERECVREAYNLLNEYANEMYGAEHGSKESGTAGDDVEASLEAELAALKEEKVSKERRFQQVESGAKNCIFISTKLEQTAPLVEKIARDIQQTGTQRTRYLLRLLPVQVTCKATEADIRASAEPMIKEAFTELGISYTTVFRSRNQAQLTQSDAQSAVNGLIDAVCPTARLDHKTPKLTVLMEVIRNVICLGVVRDYAQMRKYNLVELAKGSGPAEEGGGGAGGGGDGGGGDEETSGSGENGGEGKRVGEEGEDGGKEKGCEEGVAWEGCGVSAADVKAGGTENSGDQVREGAGDAAPAAAEGAEVAPAAESTDPVTTPAGQSDAAPPAASSDAGETAVTSTAAAAATAPTEGDAAAAAPTEGDAAATAP